MLISAKRYLLTCCLLHLFIVAFAQQRCSFDEKLSADIESKKTLSLALNEIEDLLSKWIANNGHIQERSSYTIPIVFHVLWNTAAENISAEQIQVQLDILNEDFAAKNADLNQVPTAFAALVAAVDIQFCLAQIAPDGSMTDGITRTRTFVDSLAIDDVYSSAGEGQDAWAPDSYLNVWVANLNNNQVGFGSYPGQNEQAADGVVIDYSVLGINDHPRLNLGRTLTHEVGHYFGLFHPWGDGLFNANCSGDDRISDTPIQDNTYAGQCPDLALAPPESCGSADMFMNFMNYTNDECLFMFTKGQKLRMLATLLEIRSSLLTSNGCQNIVQPPVDTGILSIGPNPVKGTLYISTFLAQAATNIELTVYALDGRRVYHFEAAVISTFFSHLIAVDKWASGPYFLVLSIGQQRSVEKILVY